MSQKTLKDEARSLIESVLEKHIINETERRYLSGSLVSKIFGLLKVSDREQNRLQKEKGIIVEGEEREYRVAWEIDLDARDKVEAAKKALEIMKEPGEAVVFSVNGERIDLMEELEEEEG